MRSVGARCTCPYTPYQKPNISRNILRRWPGRVQRAPTDSLLWLPICFCQKQHIKKCSWLC